VSRASTDAPVSPFTSHDASAPPASAGEPSSTPAFYRELTPRPELRDLLACGWQQHTGAGRTKRVVPDGCVDVIWLAGRELIVAGPATGPLLSRLPAGSTTVGVRFAPGAGAGLLGLPLDELRDRNVPLAELWGRDAAGRLEDALAEAATGTGDTPGSQLSILERALLARRSDAAPVDRLVLAAVAAATVATPARTRDLGAALGVSERQLLRRFRAAVGYGPKTLERVLRFQRFVTAAWTDASAAGASGVSVAADASAAESPDAAADGGLGRLALDAGYADQAHLSRECRSLAGVTPRQLLSGG
jgi:AraC-like DNA-binding protein